MPYLNYLCFYVPRLQTKIQITEQMLSGILNYRYCLIEAEIKISRVRP